MQSKTPDEQWEIDLDLRTRSNVPLRLVYSTNIECENRGIVVDAVSAFIGSSKVGYLKIELFPESSLQKYFPSGVLNYMSHFSGHMVLPYEQESTDIKTADLSTLQHVLKYLERNGITPARDFVLDDPKEFAPWFSKTILKGRWLAGHQKRYKEFLDFRLGKAFVAYSNTERPNHDFSEPTYSGNGIGTALYLAAALEIDRQGMRLRGSGLQSDSAQAIWQSFRNKGIVEMDEDRPYLSAPLIRSRLGIMLPSAPAFSI